MKTIKTYILERLVLSKHPRLSDDDIKEHNKAFAKMSVLMMFEDSDYWENEKVLIDVISKTISWIRENDIKDVDACCDGSSYEDIKLWADDDKYTKLLTLKSGLERIDVKEIYTDKSDWGVSLYANANTFLYQVGIINIYFINTEAK